MINTEHLTKKEIRKIELLIKNNEDVFRLPNEKLTLCNVDKHRIDTVDEKPIYVKQFPIPHAMRDIWINEVNKLKNNNLIQDSTSSYNSPSFLVKKKSDDDNKKEYRLVIDYKKLNAVTLPDRFLLPNINEIFDRLGGNKYFTTLDI